MRLVFFFLLITTCLQAQVQRLKLRQLEAGDPGKFLKTNSLGNITFGNLGDAETGELAIWRADTLYGDARIRINIDTLFLPPIIVKNIQGTLEPGIQAGLNSAQKTSLLDPRSPINFFWARDEGDGDWISTVTAHEGGIILQEVDGGAGGAPRMQFMSARTNITNTPQVPIVGDDVFYFRGIKHKGLSSSLDIYANGAGIIPFRSRVDTVYASGNLGFRTEIGAADNVSGVFSGNVDIRISRTGDLRFRTYANTRDDATTPINFLYTNNLGDLRSSPLSDIIATGTFTHDVGSILAGGIAEIGPFAVTGVIEGKPVTVGVPTTFEAGLMVFGYASAVGQVKVRIHNTTGAPVDPASQTYSISQVKL